MPQPLKSDAKKKATKKKSVALVRTAAERKDDRQSMAKTQPMNAITASMVKAHAERTAHELADTRPAPPPAGGPDEPLARTDSSDERDTAPGN